MQNFTFSAKLNSGNFYSPLYFLILYLILANITYSQSVNILLDENFSDWQDIEAAYTDPQNEFPEGNIDFGELKIMSDSENLYLYLETGSEINLQNDNEITLYIDLDNNPLTGSEVQGIGADLEYNFGQRQGKLFSEGTQYTISHVNIGLVSSPTVTSDKFEIAISREIFINSTFISLEGSIKIVIYSNRSGIDKIPEGNSGVEYVFPKNFRDLLPEFSIQKRNDLSLRIMSYNVLSGGLFSSGRKPSFRRMLAAVNPDIICFQEIYDQSSAQTAAEIESILPSGQGTQWHHSKVNPDIIVISRFDLKATYRIPSGNMAVLIDLTEINESELLLIGAHPPCCQNEDSRQKEMDEIMSFLRESQNGSGALPIERNTPIILVGDMNLVGYNRQRATLLTGDIFDEGMFGADFSPDWDGSDLEDAKPYTTNQPMTFTWYDERSSFSPGRLDYIIYSGSVLNLQNSFSLFTKSLQPDTLSLYNLEEDDSVIASDHLPLVADFTFKDITRVEGSSSRTPDNFFLEQNYPNPFNPATKIRYKVPGSVRGEEVSAERRVKLTVYDVLGREIRILVNEKQNPGEYEVEFDANNLPSGVYIYRIQSNDFVQAKKMILL